MNKRRHEVEILKLLLGFCWRFLDNSLENAVHRVVPDHQGRQKRAVKLILTHILEVFTILRIHTTNWISTVHVGRYESID